MTVRHRLAGRRVTLRWGMLALVLVGCHDATDRSNRFRARQQSTAEQYGQVAPYMLRELTTYCRDMRAEACAFRSLPFALPTPAGGVVLGDFMKVLVEFDSTGVAVREIGRLGDGPGEYRNVIAGAFSAGGVLTVFDIGNLRRVRYDSAGRHVETTRLEDLPIPFESTRMSSAGLVMFRLPGAEHVGDTVRAGFFRVPPDTTRAIETLSVDAAALTVRLSDLQPTPPLFTPRPQWDVTSDGDIVYAGAADFVIERYTSSGRPDLLIEVDMAPRPVSRSDVEARLARIEHPGQRAAIRRAGVADAQPWINALRVTADGSFWTAESPDWTKGSVRWNRFSPDGKLEGYVVLGIDSSIEGGVGDRVLIVVRDEDGPYAGWYLLTRGG